MSVRHTPFMEGATTKRCRGVSLIEVMVAVFALSIGVLGVAGLQMTAKRANFEALQRATAAALANDIIERMRANTAQLATYTNSGAGRTLTGSTIAAINCSADCTQVQLAQYDLYEWEQAVNGVTSQIGGNNTGGLSLPTACITGPDGGSGIYTVAIAWRGMTKLSDPAINACGQGLGLYDHRGGAEVDVYRRVLVVQTFILD